MSSGHHCDWHYRRGPGEGEQQWWQSGNRLETKRETPQGTSERNGKRRHSSKDSVNDRLECSAWIGWQAGVDGRTDGRIGKFEKQHRTRAARFFRLDVCCFVVKWLTKNVSCVCSKVKPRPYRSKDREKTDRMGSRTTVNTHKLFESTEGEPSRCSGTAGQTLPSLNDAEVSTLPDFCGLLRNYPTQPATGRDNIFAFAWVLHLFCSVRLKYRCNNNWKSEHSYIERENRRSWWPTQMILGVKKKKKKEKHSGKTPSYAWFHFSVALPYLKRPQFQEISDASF